MAERLFSSAHFEVRVDAGRRLEARSLGLCRVGPIASETRDGEGGSPSAAGQAPIVLRRALGEDRYLFDWRQSVAGGKPDVRTVTLRILAGPGDDHAIELRLEGCRPSRWSGPTLDAVDGGIAFEEIELVYDKLVWV